MAGREASLNLKNPAVKRIMRELRELEADPCPGVHAEPLEDNLFDWHFSLMGPRDSAFEGGIYHGSLRLPAEYPFKPPDVVLLTPNGRFELGTRVCLSITSHHSELWQPSWGIRTVLIALIAFFPTPGKGAIGALDSPDSERRRLAKLSRHWKCNKCGADMATVFEGRDEPAPKPVGPPPEADPEALPKEQRPAPAAPEPTAAPEPAPVAAPEPEPVPVAAPEPEPAPVAAPEPEPVAVPEPEPAAAPEPEPAAAPERFGAVNPVQEPAQVPAENPLIYAIAVVVGLLAALVYRQV